MNVKSVSQRFALACLLLASTACTAQTKSDASFTNGDDEGSATYLRVKSVTLYPTDKHATIVVRAYVNNIEFTFPAQGILKQGNIAPEFQTARLPPANAYQIRFELLIRNKIEASANTLPVFRLGEPGSQLADSKAITLANPTGRRSEEFAASQQITNFAGSKNGKVGLSRPNAVRASYKVYEVQGGTRMAGVRALIDYELIVR